MFCDVFSLRVLLLFYIVQATFFRSIKNLKALKTAIVFLLFEILFFTKKFLQTSLHVSGPKISCLSITPAEGALLPPFFFLIDVLPEFICIYLLAAISNNTFYANRVFMAQTKLSMYDLLYINMSFFLDIASGFSHKNA